MKIFLNIILIFTILTISVGHIFIFSIQEHFIKKEIKRALLKNTPDAELKTLVIAKNKLNSENGFKYIHSKEFKYLGEMYDIVRKFESKDSIKFVCIHDKDETALINNFVKYCKDDKNSSPIKRKINILNLDYYIITDYNVNYISFSLFLFDIESDNYNSFHPQIASPPPELFA